MVLNFWWFKDLALGVHGNINDHKGWKWRSSWNVSHRDLNWERGFRLIVLALQLKFWSMSLTLTISGAGQACNLLRGSRQYIHACRLTLSVPRLRDTDGILLRSVTRLKD